MLKETWRFLLKTYFFIIFLNKTILNNVCTFDLNLKKKLKIQRKRQQTKIKLQIREYTLFIINLQVFYF